MSAELDALFDRTASLAGRPRTVSELPGGLTNRNYKVTTPAGAFVARLSTGGTELLAIDRDCEYRNSVTAAAAGAGAPVIEYRPQDRLLVVGYIDGRTFTAADVAQSREHPAHRAGLPPPARRRQVRQRLQHVRRPARLPGGGPLPRLQDPERL